MSGTKWTPGPWSLRYSCDNSGDIGIAHPCAKNVLAECFADIRWCGENSHEVAANAHLIAAAPDLYEALRSVLDDADVDIGKGRRALAKARGEPSLPCRDETQIIAVDDSCLRCGAADGGECQDAEVRS